MQPARSIGAAAGAAGVAAARTVVAAGKPFCGMIGPILVDEPIHFACAGSVVREGANAAWTWVTRDLCPDLMSQDGLQSGSLRAAELEPALPELRPSWEMRSGQRSRVTQVQAALA
ncbi:hypothetical protein VE26_00020, partial [Devosia chinhatensis]